MSITFSGIQPSGDGVPHIGNLLGALRLFPGFVGERDRSLFCVADQHATTTAYNPATLRRASLATAAAILAVGVDPSLSIVFRQSSVPAHAGLALVLGHLARLGELERMTQFKDKGRSEGRESVGLGLLTYPVLMAADILLYRTNKVPVGDDQDQHMQLAVTLAARFNRQYGEDIFPEPNGVFVSGGCSRVMSLRDPMRKMSKSEPAGAVFITDSMDIAAVKFRRAVSETEPLPSEPAGLSDRAAARSLVDMLTGMTGEGAPSVLSRLGGRGFSDLKAELAAAFEVHVMPVGNRMRIYLDNEAGLLSVLEDGRERAATLAEATMRHVRRVAGF